MRLKSQKSSFNGLRSIKREVNGIKVLASDHEVFYPLIFRTVKLHCSALFNANLIQSLRDNVYFMCTLFKIQSVLIET